MDCDCYAEILTLQGKDPYLHEDGHQYNVVVESFRTDLLANKAVWVNDWKKDWHYFMKNNHALYSIFTTPKEHEYTRRERLVVLICCSSLFSAVAMLAVGTLEDLRVSGAGAIELFLTENLINITGAIIISIIMAKLQIMATCACFQASHEDKRERMERIGHIVMGVWSVISLICFVLGIVYCNGWGLVGEFFLSLAVQVVANVVVPTIFLTAAFHLLWIREHRMNPNEQSSFIICYHDYRDWKDGNPIGTSYQAFPAPKPNKAGDGNAMQVLASSSVSELENKQQQQQQQQANNEDVNENNSDGSRKKNTEIVFQTTNEHEEENGSSAKYVDTENEQIQVKYENENVNDDGNENDNQ